MHSHPLLCLEGITSADLDNIMDYVYNGEVKIFQEDLDRFLAVAERFKLQGLLSDQESQGEEINNQQQHNVPAAPRIRSRPASNLVKREEKFINEETSTNANVADASTHDPDTSSRELTLAEPVKISQGCIKCFGAY